jgi:nucleoside-diphosphate-sugar epimerase
VANVQTRRAGVHKADEVLEFKAKVALEQGLRELIRWRKSVKVSPALMEAV